MPTNSCVRVSRGGFVVRGALEDAMAIWMTASISSLVGPEPAGGCVGGEGAEESVLGRTAWSLGVEAEAEEEVGADEFRAEERDGRAAEGWGDWAGVEDGWAEDTPEEGVRWRRECGW